MPPSPTEAPRCEVCGVVLFQVVPGTTPQQAIREFAAQTPGWRDNPEAREGWMPPGVYCPKGCTNIHTTPIPPGAPDADRSASKFCPFPTAGLAVVLGLAALGFFLTQGRPGLAFAAQLGVLVVTVPLAMGLEAWAAREPVDRTFSLPVLGILVMVGVGGVLAWLFGWPAVLALTVLYCGLPVFFGFQSRGD